MSTEAINGSASYKGNGPGAWATVHATFSGYTQALALLAGVNNAPAGLDRSTIYRGFTSFSIGEWTTITAATIRFAVGTINTNGSGSLVIVNSLGSDWNSYGSWELTSRLAFADIAGELVWDEDIEENVLILPLNAVAIALLNASETFSINVLASRDFDDESIALLSYNESVNLHMNYSPALNITGLRPGEGGGFACFI